MYEQAYFATLEFAKAAIDRKDVERMQYWVELSMKLYRTLDNAPILPIEYRNKAHNLLVEHCRAKCDK